MKESMRQNKRRMPAIILPESKGNQLALVLTRNPHRENLCSFGAMNLPIFPHKVRTEDKPHVSSLLQQFKNKNLTITACKQQNYK